MKKIFVLFISVILIISFTACASNNQFVGDWYYSEAPDEGGEFSFYEDGNFSVYGETAGTYKAKSDSVTMVYKYDDYEVKANLKDIDGYTCLDIDGQIYIKGYDNAVSYYNEYCYDPSDIWAYDFSGKYYESYGNSSLDNLSEYEKMLKIKDPAESYTVDKEFVLTNNYSGYKNDYSVSVDIDRENYTMKLVEPSGYISGEYDIMWCEETEEFYFVDKSFEHCIFKLDNVNES